MQKGRPMQQSEETPLLAFDRIRVKGDMPHRYLIAFPGKNG
jgi:hypothetical protein